MEICVGQVEGDDLGNSTLHNQKRRKKKALCTRRIRYEEWAYFNTDNESPATRTSGKYHNKSSTSEVNIPLQSIGPRVKRWDLLGSEPFALSTWYIVTG